MKISITLIVLSLTVLSIVQACTAPYWEIQKNAITFNEPEKIAQSDFTLNSVSKVQNGTLSKVHIWNITNITAKSNGDGQNVTVTNDGNNINVNDYFINLTLSFSATAKVSNNQTYTGSGVVSIKIYVNYTKQFVVGDGQVTFKYVSSSQSYNGITIFYSPSPSDTDKPNFDTLIQTNVLTELKSYYNSTLIPSLKQQIEAQKVNLTFGGNYTYQFSNFSVDYNMGVSTLQIVNKTNLAVGFNASINGSSTCAKAPKPYDDLSSSASFFSNQFCQSLFNNSLQNNQEWKQISLDSRNSSNIFEFQMKDLTLVIPDAIKTYPGLFVKVYVVCNSTEISSSLNIDPLHKSLSANALWNCTLFRTGGYGLAGFVTNITYTATLSQNNKKLINNITNINLADVDFYPLLFNVEDKKLASNYIVSVLNNFVLTQTVGSDFVQPQRTSPVVTYNDDYIKINNAVGIEAIRDSLIQRLDLKLE